MVRMQFASVKQLSRLTESMMNLGDAQKTFFRGYILTLPKKYILLCPRSIYPLKSKYYCSTSTPISRAKAATSRCFTSSIGTALCNSCWREVTPLSTNPQGLM